MPTFTITLGDQAENHKGMKKIGNPSTIGFNLKDLTHLKEWFSFNGCETHIAHLNDLLEDVEVEVKPDNAYILVIRKGLDVLLKGYGNSDDFYKEQEILKKDTQAFMYGRVVNKHARHNLCFGYEAQKSDIANGKGTVIPFDEVPLLNIARLKLEEILENKGKNLVAEGNYYYDIHITGIGYHGDSERVKVIAIRVGEDFPLCFQWFYKNEWKGYNGEIILGHGDIYVMSHKAVGNDWKKSSIYTLRHAAGAEKFIKL